MINTFQALIDFAKLKFSFTPEDEKLIARYFEQQLFGKNEIILNAGDVCNKIYFIKKGSVRTFHVNKNGSEFTRLIATENEFCTILISFLEKIASPASIQAMEKTEVLVIDRNAFRDFIEVSPNAEKMYTKILEDFQNFQIKRLEFLTSFSPQEKVDLFLKENPDLEARLTDKVIASYLQITPETFSRCKNKRLQEYLLKIQR